MAEYNGPTPGTKGHMHPDNIVVSEEDILAAYRTANEACGIIENNDANMHDMYQAFDSIASALLLQLIEAGVEYSRIDGDDQEVV